MQKLKSISFFNKTEVYMCVCMHACRAHTCIACLLLFYALAKFCCLVRDDPEKLLQWSCS